MLVLLLCYYSCKGDAREIAGAQHTLAVSLDVL